MKLLAALCGFLAIATGAVLQEQKVSYDGYKVVRVTVGDDATRINAIVADLGLTTWKGAPKAGGLADIVVPPQQADAFHSRIGSIEMATMHEDLGAAIATESSFGAYGGKCWSP